jgi:NAD(P)-dependent dehydrogenase (short-subunit alcohol dehydrogenase family)
VAVQFRADRAAATETMASLGAGGGHLALRADVADPEQARTLVGRVVGELGRVDVLVNNAGIYEEHSVLQTSYEDWVEVWRRTIDVNLLGTATLLELTAPGMAERGFGRVVVIASEWGVIGWPNATSYAASKGGLIALVKSAARALGPHGVAVNAVAPGITDTPQLQVDADDAGISLAEMIERYAQEVPLGRVGRPEDIAEVVAFLCSDPAIALVGQVLQPNGGTTR